MSRSKTFSSSLHCAPGLTLHCPGLVVPVTTLPPPWGWSCFSGLLPALPVALSSFHSTSALKQH